jgi:hypothetical protein
LFIVSQLDLKSQDIQTLYSLGGGGRGGGLEPPV